MKQILLTKGKVAIVDDEDYQWLNQWKWCVNGCNYPSRYDLSGTKKKFVTMHRFIMGNPRGFQIDHKNGDRLDNRKQNLRACTHSQNCVSRKSWRTSKNGYRGVRLSYKRWFAVIEQNGKRQRSKSFKTPKEAALAYNEMAKQVFGEFARLNDI